MLPVVWLPAAEEDLASIIGYIGELAPLAAERLWHRLRDCVLPLAEHPYLYPQSDRVPGLREVVVTPSYIVLYRVTVAAIQIVSVVHSSQHFPR